MDAQDIENLINQVSTNGEPDRDKVQKMLTERFILALLARQPGTSPDEVVIQFGGQYHGSLGWLGEDRQDQILKTAQLSTGIDFSSWLNKEK